MAVSVHRILQLTCVRGSTVSSVVVVREGLAWYSTVARPGWWDTETPDFWSRERMSPCVDQLPVGVPASPATWEEKQMCTPMAVVAWRRGRKEVRFKTTRQLINVSPFIHLYFSVSFCMYVCLSVCLFVYMYLSFSTSTNIPLFLCLHLSAYQHAHPFVSLYESIPHICFPHHLYLRSPLCLCTDKYNNSQTHLHLFLSICLSLISLPHPPCLELWQNQRGCVGSHASGAGGGPRGEGLSVHVPPPPPPGCRWLSRGSPPPGRICMVGGGGLVRQELWWRRRRMHVSTPPSILSPNTTSLPFLLFAFNHPFFPFLLYLLTFILLC